MTANRPTEELLREMTELVRVQTDDNECTYDHHGYCQMHSASILDDTQPSGELCWNVAAKRLIAEVGE